MTRAVETPSRLSPDQERLLSFVNSNAPAGPIGTLIVLCVWWLSPSHSPIFPILGVGTVVNWILVWRAIRVIRENHLRKAIFMVSTGMWSLAFGLGVLVPMAFALAAIVAMLPIAVSVAFSGTYIGRPLLLRIIILSTVVTGVGAVFTWFPPIFPLDAGLTQTALIVSHVTVTVLVASAGLALWNESQRVVDTLDELRGSNRALEESNRALEESNRALEESERTLEDKVERRTTQLAEAREGALEASRAKSEFLANMSHELRTPLNAIIGYSEMLMEEAQDSGQEDAVPDLDRILVSGRYLLTLINGVLDLSKIEAGKMDVYLERFDVRELVEGVVGTIQPLIRKNANALQVGDLAGLGAMHSDVTKLRQTLFNLLSNASKFTERGTIHLDVARETVEGDEWLCFTVTDSGIGMTPAQLDRIFEAFSQADASTTREYGGTGLGLAITKQFCQMLGGGITANSEPGRGSTFEIRLPARAPSSQPELASETPSGAPVAEVATKILVVDDDAAARDLVSRYLTRQGLSVVSADNGADALRLAREHRPDVITLDIVMPGMDGWQVLRELKADESLTEIPVILITMLDDQNLGYALGASEYMTKPVDWERLGAVVRRFAHDEAEDVILVVDDDPMARDMMRRGVEQTGFAVVEAESGRDALERIAARKPRLILLDLLMPDMDGFEFVAQLRLEPGCRAIPIVVVTAKDLTVADRARLNGSVSRILQKGSHVRTDLMDEIRRLIGTRLQRGSASDGQDSAGRRQRDEP